MSNGATVQEAQLKTPVCMNTAQAQNARSRHQWRKRGACCIKALPASATWWLLPGGLLGSSCHGVLC